MIQKKDLRLRFASKISAARLIIGTAIFMTLFFNFRFFKNIIAVYPMIWGNIGFLCSAVVIFAALMVFALTLLCFKYTLKPVLIVLLTVSSLTAYFMDTYNVIIDTTMLQNISATDPNEIKDLFSFKLLSYLVFLGLAPSLFIYKIQVVYGSFATEQIKKAMRIILSLMIITVLLFSFSRFYTSFFREHRMLRYYANPIAWVHATGKYIRGTMKSDKKQITPIGMDARASAADTGRQLIILVVGEAVRADRLSLNGYFRETTPLLQQEEVINFSNMYSCGTTTVISVPCMFSVYERRDFSREKGNATENLLDVLTRAGVHVLWRDNNSSSKGVADRVPYEDFRHPDKNPVCDDGECRDEGMLNGLQTYIDDKKTGDILIILHQLGNHGPAYYKRYPKSFEKFTPVCQTNQVEQCAPEEIGNAYDNCILYTDYFLTKTIDLLKQNAGRFEAAMIYMSDHGESLGENGLYLHGLPYALAPDDQKHVATVMWFSDSFKIDRNALMKKADTAFSQDYLFHTILGLMKIETEVYDKRLDIVNYDQ